MPKHKKHIQNDKPKLYDPQNAFFTLPRMEKPEMNQTVTVNVNIQPEEKDDGVKDCFASLAKCFGK